MTFETGLILDGSLHEGRNGITWHSGPFVYLTTQVRCQAVFKFNSTDKGLLEI